MKAVLILDNPHINNNFFPLLQENQSLSMLDTSANSNLLSVMYSYINSYFAKDKIYVVCVESEIETVKKTIPDILDENIIVEPIRISYTFSLMFANVIIEMISSDKVVCCFPVNHLSTCNFMLQNWFLSVQDMASKDKIVMPSILLNKNDVVPVYVDGGKIYTNIGGTDYFNVDEIAYVDVQSSKSHRKKKLFGKQGHLLNVLCGSTSSILSLYRSREAAGAVATLKRLFQKSEQEFSWKSIRGFYEDCQTYENFDIYSDCEKLVVVFIESRLTDLTTWNDYIQMFKTDNSNNVIVGKVAYKDCHDIICYNYDNNEEFNIEHLNNLIIIKKNGTITIRNI